MMKKLLLSSLLDGLLLPFSATFAVETAHWSYSGEEGPQNRAKLSPEFGAFDLKQFHFHAPSENHINGKSFALEAHLVYG